MSEYVSACGDTGPIAGSVNKAISRAATSAIPAAALRMAARPIREVPCHRCLSSCEGESLTRLTLAWRDGQASRQIFRAKALSRGERIVLLLCRRGMEG